MQKKTIWPITILLVIAILFSALAVADETLPPSSVTGLGETSVSSSSITWEWTNPSDNDSSHTEIYLDGVFITNVSAPGNSYTASGLDESTSYQIGTRTVDTYGNINTDMVSDSATTSDVTAPSSVTGLGETSVSSSSITWEWTNPSDSDFSHTEIYLDGIFITNIAAPGNSYTASGLDESTSYQIGTRTVDTDGNINTDMVSDSATTSDVTAPSSVTGLGETSVSSSSITWEWTNPSDSDFSHTEIYLDGIFITNIAAPGNSYTASGLDESTSYQIGTRTVDTDGNINTDMVSDSATTSDVTAPSSVTGLGETSVSSSSITWEWTNPSDSDFSHTEIYLDGIFITNIAAPGNSYTASGLDESTSYQIGTRTVDTDGNINTDMVSDSATTSDVTAPSSVTGLGETSVSSSSITWEWTNPSDSDFSHTEIYLDGIFITNIAAPGNSYTASGLDESTSYQIGTRTVDTDGNINTDMVSDSATTSDVTAPSSVTGLGETSVSSSSITWEWTNPSDSDFSHTEIYLDGIFITNIAAPGNSYTASGLDESTSYQIGTRTVDTDGNINTDMVSDSATTSDVTAPSSVTGLGETSVSSSSITWEWTNPSDSDFSHTEIYLDGIFITNIAAPGNSYTASGLDESTSYQIGTRTVDTDGNINTDMVSDSATTSDVTAPSSVTGLGETSVSSSSITWEWTNPSDSDFSHTEIYLDGIFITNIAAPGNSYTASGLDESTSYQIGTRTVDTDGNINTDMISDSATTSDVTAPSSVTGLGETSVSSSSITWEWTNPSDSDFSHTEIYLDGVFITNIAAPGNSYTASGLDESTSYQIGTRTVDTDGNINTNMISDSATTSDVTAPSSVTGLAESSVASRSIAWSWANPSDGDFSHTMIYLNGVFVTNVSTPGNTYLASHLSEDTTYQISTRTVDTNGNINTNWVSDTATTLDRSAPSSITRLSESSVTVSSIAWSWRNPSDSDFSHTMIYLDGVFMTNVSTPGNTYLASGLSESTTYQISTRTVDTNGNINTNLVSDTATTLDLTPPSSVTGLSESSVTVSSITWEWTNPSDSDFSHTMIYLDGVFTTSIHAPYNSYVVTGLSESTTYQISTRTVDTNGNVNTNLVNDTATTLDLTPPSSITFLSEYSVTGSSIAWSWANPSDSDFSHTRIYLDGLFLTSVSAPGNSYTATGLSEFTTYRISTRTVDTSGNINTNWVNDSATTSNSTSQSFGGGSSGGGSSSTTAEAFENIAVKDVAVRHVIRDLENSFTFRNEGIDITYINISTDLNVGEIKAIVESLKSTSSMVSTPAEGMVYKNINIWVGDDALKNRLTTSDVGFRVNRMWLEDNGVSENSVKLSIYHSGGWDVLATEKTDEDDEYIYYETDTSGDLYSQFAIVEYVDSEPVSFDTSEEAVAEDNNVPEPMKEKPALVLEGDAGIVASESERTTGSGLNVMFLAIPVLMVLILLSVSYVGVTKGYHATARGGDVGSLDDIQVAEGDVSETVSDSTNVQERSGQSAETITPVQLNEPHQVDIEQKLKKLEESGILSDVVHKNKK